MGQSFLSDVYFSQNYEQSYCHTHNITKITETIFFNLVLKKKNHNYDIKSYETVMKSYNRNYASYNYEIQRNLHNPPSRLRRV